jgi:hypothetical protein
VEENFDEEVEEEEVLSDEVLSEQIKPIKELVTFEQQEKPFEHHENLQ